MFEITELISDLVQGARAPALTRSLLIFEQRISALNDASRNDSMKRGAVIETGASELDELSSVLWSFGWEEFKTNDAELSCDNGFELIRLLHADGSIGLCRLRIALLLLGKGELRDEQNHQRSAKICWC